MVGSSPRYQILSHVFARCASHTTHGHARIARVSRVSQVSRAIDVLYGKELQRLACLGAVDDKVFGDYVLRKMTAWYERYPPKNGKKGDGGEESREDEDDAGDGEDGGVEYEDVARLQPSDSDGE